MPLTTNSFSCSFSLKFFFLEKFIRTGFEPTLSKSSLAFPLVIQRQKENVKKVREKCYISDYSKVRKWERFRIFFIFCFFGFFEFLSNGCRSPSGMVSVADSRLCGSQGGAGDGLGGRLAAQDGTAAVGKCTGDWCCCFPIIFGPPPSRRASLPLTVSMAESGNRWQPQRRRGADSVMGGGREAARRRTPSRGPRVFDATTGGFLCFRSNHLQTSPAFSWPPPKSYLRTPAETLHAEHRRSAGMVRKVLGAVLLISLISFYWFGESGEEGDAFRLRRNGRE